MVVAEDAAVGVEDGTVLGLGFFQTSQVVQGQGEVVAAIQGVGMGGAVLVSACGVGLAVGVFG